MKELIGSKKAYFLFIAKYINEHGYAPTYPDVAKYFRVTKANIFSRVNELIEEGYLIKLEKRVSNLTLSSNGKEYFKLNDKVVDKVN